MGGLFFQRKDPPYFRRVNGIYIAPCPPCAKIRAVNLRRLSITKGKADACGVRLPKIENKKGGMKYMMLVPIIHAIIILLPLVAFNRIFELIGESVKGFTMQTKDVLPRISHPDGYLFEPQAVDVSERQENGIA